jgi:hypothetical protein
MSDILAVDEGAGLAAEFEAAADNPESFDFAFKAEREATGFANFGFDPEKAAAMRAADPSNAIDPDEDEDWDDEDDDEDNDDSSLEW